MTRIATVVCTLSLLIAGLAGAQETPHPAPTNQPPAAPTPPKQDPALLQELNRDIWLPFTEAYAALDADKYLGLHSKDFIRGEGDRKLMLDLEGYSTEVRRFFANMQRRGDKPDIQFRFLERFASAQFASERGIYQFTMAQTEGEPRKYYGKFHVFSRKEGGTWKILVDYDSNENGTIDEASYQAGRAVDDLGQD
jgi:ketosteroid isomerase-like protein